MNNPNVTVGDKFVGVLAFEKSPYVLEGVLLEVAGVDGDQLTLKTIPVTEHGELFPQTVEGVLAEEGLLRITGQTGEHELLAAVYLGKPVQEATLTDIWHEDTGTVEISYTADNSVAIIKPAPPRGYMLSMSPIDALYTGAVTAKDSPDIYLSNTVADKFATATNITRWNIYNVNCFKPASHATPVTAEEAKRYKNINPDPYTTDTAIKAVGTAQRHMYRLLTTGLASKLTLHSSTPATGKWEAGDSTRIIDEELNSSLAALDEAIQQMEALKDRITQTINTHEGA
jgi:hypothetical protein